jgi:hypothetical protein
LENFQMLDRQSDDAQHRHLVQFYDAAPGALVQNVARFIDEGLRTPAPVLVVATPEHTDEFLGALAEYRTGDKATRARHLTMLDAEATMEQFLVNGMPDWQRFERVVGGTVRRLCGARGGSLRVYGEMVGILWSQGNIAAAVQLEKFWNVLLTQDDFSLFCGYPIDIFGEGFHRADVHDILCTHTHVIGGGEPSAMEFALERAMHEVLGDGAQQIRTHAGEFVHKEWGVMPAVEAMILWLRSQKPDYATEILSRARRYYSEVA